LAGKQEINIFPGSSRENILRKDYINPQLIGNTLLPLPDNHIKGTPILNPFLDPISGQAAVERLPERLSSIVAG
jgi:hypothetical protein